VTGYFDAAKVIKARCCGAMSCQAGGRWYGKIEITDPKATKPTSDVIGGGRGKRCIDRCRKRAPNIACRQNAGFAIARRHTGITRAGFIGARTIARS
jgi:hypothetical protein